MIFDKNKIFSSIFYFIGMTSLVFADIFIVKYYPSEFIADWAFLKSLLFIGGSILVFGLDQMFIRHSLKITVYFPKFVIHLIIFSLIFSIFVYFKKYNLFIIIVLFLFALNQLFFGATRANFHYQLSQAILQGWKIFFFFVILLAYFLSFKANNVYVFVIASFVIPIILLSKFIIKIINDGEVTNASMKILYQDAFLMFISIITLNIAMYADQILIKEFASRQNIIKLFAHTSSIYPAGIAFNGLAGFFLGPYFKKRPNTSVRKIIIIILPLALFLSLISFVVGILILKFIRHIQMDFNIGIMLSLVVFLRVLYILPSSYIGVIGSQKMLKSFVIICIVGVLIQIVGFLALAKFTSINIIYAAVISVALHWFIRSMGGILNIYFLKNVRSI
ncbi:hypothetical protein ACX8XN_12755 [Calditrichota bacterium GD2]